MSRKTRGRPRVERLEDRTTPTTLPAGFSEATVTSGLASPTAMEFSPAGELWVLEQTGRAKLVRGDGTTHTAVTLTVNSSGERGLLGLAFSPSYDGAGPNADQVYLYYTATAPAVHNRISRFTVTGAGTATPTLTAETTILDLENLSGATNHNGGAIHFGPDGKLYVAVGDNNDDTTPGGSQLSQRLDSRFGKVLRLNPDGTNPNDNPFFVGNNAIRDSIWALGLRNPYATAFQPGTGRYFVNDVGESNWEEINDGVAGSNYGWAGSFSSPLMEGFETSVPAFITIGTYRDPVMAYDHNASAPSPFGCAVTGGAFYNPATPRFGSAYVGKYFFADYCGPSNQAWIRVFDPASPGSAASPDTSTAFASDMDNLFVVDLKVDAAGNLYYLGRGGGVVRRITFQAADIDLAGSADNDTYLFSVSGGTVRYTDKAGAVIDTGKAPASGLTIRLDGLGGNDRIDLSALTAAQYKGATLLGGAGNDTLDGGAANDVLDGGDKGDDLAGRDGDDSLVGGAGEDEMLGNAGNDTLDGGDQHDNLWGGPGNDKLDGAGDRDYVDGGLGDDTLGGGVGNDVLRGGQGNDVQDGGAGLDSYLVGGAQAEFDTFNDTGGTAGDALINIDESPLTLSGFSAAATGLEGIDNDGNADGPDQPILGNASANALNFAGINLFGVLYIDGGAGNDTLTGSSGADDLRGGPGDDRLTGGPGSDTFAHVSAGGSDSDDVTDFVKGTDLIRFVGFVDGGGNPIDFADLVIALTGGDTEITLPSGKRVRLLGFTGSLAASDFLFG